MGNSSGPGSETFGDYELPDGVGDGAVNDGDPNPEQFDGAQGDGSAGADDGQGDEGDHGAARSDGGAAGDQGARRAPGAAGGRQGKPESFPTHRFEALERTIQEMREGLRGSTAAQQRLEAENRRLRLAIGAPERQPAPRQFSARDQRLRAQISQLMPELAVLSDARLQRLLERAQDIDRIATEYPNQSASETRRWGGHAERMVRQVQNHAATQWLGAGKQLKDLDPDDRDELDSAFVRWVSRRAEAEERDLPNGHYGETTLRYEAADPALVTEFWSWFTRRHGGTAGGGVGERRSAGMAAGERAAAGGRGPRGGSSSAAVGSAAREVKPKTLDEALDEGWSAVQNQRAGA